MLCQQRAPWRAGTQPPRGSGTSQGGVCRWLLCLLCALMYGAAQRPRKYQMPSKTTAPLGGGGSPPSRHWIRSIFFGSKHLKRPRAKPGRPRENCFKKRGKHAVDNATGKWRKGIKNPSSEGVTHHHCSKEKNSVCEKNAQPSDFSGKKNPIPVLLFFFWKRHMFSVRLGICWIALNFHYLLLSESERGKTPNKADNTSRILEREKKTA